MYIAFFYFGCISLLFDFSYMFQFVSLLLLLVITLVDKCTILLIVLQSSPEIWEGPKI